MSPLPDNIFELAYLNTLNAQLLELLRRGVHDPNLWPADIQEYAALLIEREARGEFDEFDEYGGL